MTKAQALQEMSDRFDIYYNNITSNQAPGLNEYEKSVFLTKAQEELIKNYFNPKGNKYQEGFDGSIKRQSDFANLLVTESLATCTSTAQFDTRSLTYLLPDKVFLIVNEQFQSTNNRYVVVPISYESYDLYMQKPYKYPPKNQVWRLITNNTISVRVSTSDATTGSANDNTSSSGSGTSTSVATQTQSIASTGVSSTNSTVSQNSSTTLRNGTVVEIIGALNSTISYTYKMRYIKRPSPIILVDLSGTGLSIYGENEQTECELPEHMHEEILQRAVELAKIAWTSNGQDNTQAFVQSGERIE